MSRESDFKTVLSADFALGLILTGGIYAFEDVGVEGISRETTPDAFSSGYLLPCCLIKQRAETIGNEVVDFDTLLMDTTQVVELWLYEDRGYSAIDAAKLRLMGLLNGYIFTTAFDAKLAFVIDRERDRGALKGASLARMDWQIWSIIQ